MITRIVKMQFDKDKIEDFVDLFHHVKSKILAMRGCVSLELLQDTEQPGIFFTYSTWKSLQDLENYRSSPFFRETWTKTKSYFIERPEAWSTVELFSSQKEKE